jgi:Spy/CpxP family protein refolding chaperone
MSSRILRTFAASAVLAMAAALAAPYAEAADGKSCHMQQQCKWVNFKKICVWVQVCK